jgi:hypothetical protein
MNSDDNFQVINQHGPNELVFTETFRGGPRSEDWLVLRITDGAQREDGVLRRFYATLVERLGRSTALSRFPASATPTPAKR